MAETTRNPVQARARRTRAALLQAAAEEFSSAGYAGTTASTIAARAGVATGSFYQYFADKDAALREICRERSDRLWEGLNERGAQARDGDPSQALGSLIRQVLAYHRQDTGLHAVLTERRHADPEIDAIVLESERRFLDGIESELFARGATGDLRALSFVVFAMIEGAVHAHVLGFQAVSDQRLVAALGRALLSLVAANAGKPPVKAAKENRKRSGRE
jgi:AcrR family transcriptional regulator